MTEFTLGSYRSVATSPMRLLAGEPLTWTILGLWGRRTRSRKALAAVAGLHLAHVRYVLSRVERDERLIDSAQFANVHAVLTVLRYLVYPAVSERRTYWRGTPDNAAFFMQLWLPPVLFGASGGPRKAITHGTTAALAGYAAAAILNGDTLLPEDGDGVVVLRRIGNYTFTAGLVGVVVAAIVAILTEADAEATKETELTSQVLSKSALVETLGDTLEVDQLETRRSLDRLRVAAKTLYRNEPLLSRMLDALSFERSLYGPPPRDGEPLDHIVRRYAECYGLVVDLDVPGDVYLTLLESTALSLLASNAAQNAAVHGLASRLSFAYTQRGSTVVVRISDDGAGIPALPEVNEHHGLGRARHVVESIGGRLRLERTKDGKMLLIASWSRQ